MKPRLPRNRPIGPGLVGLCAGLTQEAAERLTDMVAAPTKSMHQARVALKRARSALRLLEKTGTAWAIMPRYRLAELAGMMSAARETAVTKALAHELSRRLRGGERDVVGLLATRGNRAGSPDLAQIRPALLRESREIGLAPAPVIPPAQLRHLVTRSLDRAARKYYEAATSLTPEAVHEWRKAVIVLRDQTGFAAARWPEGAGTAHPLLVQFARRLGQRGDLVLLVRRLRQLRVPPALKHARRSLITRLETQIEDATLTAMLRWLHLKRRLTRLLAE